MQSGKRMEKLRAIISPGLLLGALMLFAPSALHAELGDLEKIRAQRQQLENSPAPTPEQVRPALENIAVSLERGWKSEAEALALAVERTSGSWSNSPAGNALRLELQFRQAQILARHCQAEPARKRFEELRRSIVASRRDLTADLDDELGMIAAWEGRFAEALTKHLATVSTRRDRPEDSGLGRSLNLLGAAQLTLGRNKEAGDAFDEARTVFDRFHDERGSAITRLNRAVLLRAKGDLRTAHSELSGVIAFAHTNGHPDIEADALANDAAVLEGVGRYKDALGLAETSLRLQEQMENCRALARLHSTLGVLAQKMGNFKRADEEFNAALKLAREHGDRAGELTATNNIGWLMAALNQPAEAQKIFTALRSERRAGADRAGEADAIQNLGAVQFAEGKFAEARASFDEALQLRRELADTKGVAALLINLGNCDVRSGSNDLAVAQFKEARALAVEAGALPLEAAALNSLGVAYRNLDRFDLARNELAQARLLRAQMGDPVAEAVTLNNLMVLAQAENRPAAAIFFGKESVTRFQSVRRNLLWLPVEAQQSFTRYCQSTYRRLADLLVEAGRLPEAQQVLTMLKEEERFEFHQRDARVADGANTTVGENTTEAGWKKTYAEISDRIIALSEERAALEARGAARTPAETVRLEKLRADLGANPQAMKEFLEKIIGERGTIHPDDIAKKIKYLKALQEPLEELGPGTVLLNYVVGPENVSIILTTPRIQVGRLSKIAEEDLNHLVFEFRETLRSGRLQDPLPQAQELYRLLLGPVEEDLKQARARTLMVSLDGTLRYLPLAALHNGESYVAEKYAVALFTEAGKTTLKDRPRKDWSVTGLGLTRKVGAFNELPYVREELHGIVREPGSKSGVLPGVVWLDDQFTANKFANALQMDRPVLHIASHFVFNPGTVTNSYLLLGDGSKLTLQDIEDRDLRFGKMDLVTLSACETAVSEKLPGSGLEIEGFTDAAQLQGAKGILATLWSVDDESTCLLMQEFYRLRAANPKWSKAEAIRQAQIKLLTGKVKRTQASDRRAARLPGEPGVKPSTDFSHPYFWAPFVLTGNWQ